MQEFLDRKLGHSRQVRLQVILLINQMIQITETLILLDSQNLHLNLTLLIILVMLSIYTIYLVKLQKYMSYYYCYGILLLMIINQVEANRKLSLVSLQIILTDILISKLIIMNYQRRWYQNFIALFLVFIMQVYSFVRIYYDDIYHYSEITFSIILICLMKCNHYLDAQLKVPSIQTQAKDNSNMKLDSNIELLAYEQVPQSTETSIYKAFDILHNGIVILEKSDSELEPVYVNSTVNTIMGTNNNDQIMDILLTIKSSNLFSHTEQDLPQFESSLQCIQQKKIVSTVQVFQFVQSFANLAQQPIIQQPLFKHQSEQHLFQIKSLISGQILQPAISKQNEQADQSNKLHEIKIPYPISQQNIRQNRPIQDNKNEQKPSIISSISLTGHQQDLQYKKLTSIGKNMQYVSKKNKTYQVVQIWDVIQQMWDQTLLVFKDDKRSLSSHKQLQYVLQSKVFLTMIEGEKPLYVEITIFTAINNNKPIVLLNLKDVQYKEYIKQLQNKTEQKSKTLNFVSHEFRTPLNCSINMLQQVIERQFITDPEDLSSIQSALANSEYCLNLAQDLLDLAQIQAGKFSINIKKFDLSETLKECLRMFTIQANKQNITLSIDLDPSIKYIQSDQKRVKQIIINLIGNAMKFTLQGQIILRCHNENDNQILVEVEDSGIGVKQEDQDKLFKAFGKIKNQQTNSLNEQGVGLGLIISNQICQQLSINNQGLGFVSEYGKGTIFCFHVLNHIQLESEHNLVSERILNDTVESKIKQLKSYRIRTSFSNSFVEPLLIVDDNQFNIESLKYFLIKSYPSLKCEFTISPYLAEQKCLENLSKIPYRLIFMDIEMPYQDGITTAKNIRLQYEKQKRQVIIIGCTAHNIESYQTEDSPMDEYIEKPVTKVIVERIMQQYYLNVI